MQQVIKIVVSAALDYALQNGLRILFKKFFK